MRSLNIFYAFLIKDSMTFIITQLDEENFRKQKWDFFLEFYVIISNIFLNRPGFQRNIDKLLLR